VGDFTKRITSRPLVADGNPTFSPDGPALAGGRTSPPGSSQQVLMRRQQQPASCCQWQSELLLGCRQWTKAGAVP
jgi:hypothetical protein